MRTLTILTPSRGRPDNIDRLRATFDATCQAETTLHVAVDKSDPTHQDYWARINTAAKQADGPAWTENRHTMTVFLDERRRLGPTLNEVSARIDTDAVGFMGDDHVPLTEGWDTAMLAALDDMPGGVGIVYGNDLIQGETLPTAVVMSTSIVQTLGQMVPPEQLHLYLDNYWRDLGREAGCLRYLPDVVIEHRHPLVGRAPSDAGYVECNSDEMTNHDSAAYMRYKAAGRLDADVAKVRALIAAAVS